MPDGPAASVLVALLDSAVEPLILIGGEGDCIASKAAARRLDLQAGDASGKVKWKLPQDATTSGHSSPQPDTLSIALPDGRIVRLQTVASTAGWQLARLEEGPPQQQDAALPVWEWRIGRGMVHVSPAWSSLTCTEYARALGNGWLEALAEQDREPARLAVESAVLHEKPVHLEVRLARPDRKTPRWVLLYGEPLRSRNGLVLGLRGVFTDLTNVQHREERLNRPAVAQTGDQDQKRLQMLGAVMADLSDLVLIVDTDFRLVAFNDAFAQQTEDLLHSKPQIGMTLGEVLEGVPTILKESIALWTRALCGEQFSLSRSIRVPGRKSIVYELCFLPLPVDGGGAVDAAALVMRDISEQVHARQRLRQLATQLEEKLARRSEEINALIHNSPVSFCLFDRDLRYARINRIMAEMKGGAITDFVGRKLGDLRPQYRESLRELVERVFDTGKPIDGAEITISDGTEDLRDLLVVVFPVKGTGGVVTQVGVVAMDITARNQAALQLQRSEERYRSLLQAGRDAVLIYPIQDDGSFGNFTEVNDAACRRYGYTREQMLQMNVGHLVRSRDEAAIKSALQHLLKERQMVSVSEHQSASGDIIPVEVSASVHEVGGRQYVLSSCRDIRERLQAERALRESETRFRYLADSMPQIVWTAQADGSVDYVNKRWNDYLNPDPAHTLQEQVRLATHPDDLARAESEWLHCVETHQMFQMELRLLHARNREYRWQLVRALPVGDRASNSVCWYGTTTDIHDQKQAAQALEVSQTRLSMALEIAHAGTWDWDLETNKIIWSDGHYRLLGLKQGQVKPTYELWKQSIHPDDRESALHSTDFRARPGDDPHTEWRCIWPDGSVHWIEGRGRVFRDNEGKPVRQIGVVIDIDARKASENLLKESEDRFRSTFDNAAVGMAHVALDGTWALVNDTLCNIVGYTREELLDGLTFQDITHPEDLKDDLALVQQLERGEIDDYKLEKRYRKKNGSLVWVRLTASARRNPDGSIRHYIAVVQDITERKRAEADRSRYLNELSAANALLDNLVENAPVGIGFWDTSLRWVRLNEALAEINGLSREEHIGKTVAELLPKMPSDIMMAFRHVLETGDIIRHSVSGETPAAPGVLRFWDFIYYPVQVGGETVGIGAICEEVTERRRAQEAILRANERIRSILESIGDAFMSLDHGFRFSYVNHTAAELLRKNPHELQGGNLWEMFPELRDTLFEERFVRSMRSGENQQFEARLESWDQWFDVRVYATGDGLSVFFADVTERKKAEQALHRAKEAAEAANRAKSAFLASMSHDIRTPLTSILGFAELLAERVGPEERQHAESIRKGGERLMETLNSVLALARLEGRRIDLRPTLVNAGVELSSLRQMFLRQVEEKGLQLRMNLPSQDVWIEVDRSGLSRALMNLIGNAIKYTAKGNITLSLLNSGKDVLLRVSDTGQGIPPHFLPRVFDAFVRGADGGENSPEGSGLGLAITRQIVELMGGRIEVTSELGRGTSFTMYFPKATKDENEAQPKVLTAEDGNSAARRKMLVVEDYQNIRTILRVMLEDQYDLRMESTVDGALKASREFFADLVLLDINIEEKDSGVHLFHKLRASDKYVGVPIVAFTAYAMPEDQERFAEIGFDSCLVKPFTRQSLEAALKEALARSTKK